MIAARIMTVVAALLCAVGCSGGSTPSASTDQQGSTSDAKPSRSLVVYFSHAGDNYGVGSIAVGNTKVVAGYIAELTGADQFEIRTSKYDGMAYKPLCDLAKEEQQRGELPEFEGDIDGIADDYDIVYIGSPVWWGTYPQVVFSFFARHDLNGKTLVPFTTHEGSGLGSCVRDLQAAYPQATVTRGFAIYGHDVQSGRERVAKWLRGLGYID